MNRQRPAALEPVENWTSSGDLQAKVDQAYIQWSRAQARLNTALHALSDIRNHHVRLNERAGRPIEDSKTIALCDAVLKEKS